MNKHKINRIARNIIAENGENVLDDYFTFYSDGYWIIQICRKLIKTVKILTLKISAFNTNIQVIDEYIEYLNDVKFDDMSTSESYKEIKEQVKQVKKNYNNYIKEQDEEILKDYANGLKKLKEYLEAYERSCVSVFKTHYKEDEPNVANLLNIIREKGNKVIEEN